MILEEIRLTNFRCFFGENVIKFSTDPDSNVTLIYAENGVGKTTLLNALLWCFYGKTTERFEKREDILNYDAEKEGRTIASVEVLFEHNDKDYSAKRYFGADLNRTFVISRIDQGSRINISPPDVFINTVIAQNMASHFLFDGEHAEVFLGEGNRDSIKDAVRDILGCSLIETAITDLRAVMGQFRRQIPSTPAKTPNAATLNSRDDELTIKIEEYEKEVKRSEKQLQTTQMQIDDIAEKLRNSSAAKELQLSRDHEEGGLKRTQARQRGAANEVYKWLGENGRAIVSKKITEETFDFLDDKKHRGRIPSPYNEEFVKDILQEETCICGAHLEPGSPAAQRVARLLDKAANQVVRDRITKVRARISNLKSERAKAVHRLTGAKSRLAEANRDIGLIESRLGEISMKLKGVNLEDIASREKRRTELLSELRVINRRIGFRRNDIRNAEAEKKIIHNKIKELAQQDQQTAIYAKRIKLCESIKDTLESDMADEEKRARKALRIWISEILADTAHKVLTLKMTNDYVISLVDSEEMELPKSSGENQLLGIAFTAALVKFAKVRQNATCSWLLPGTIAPLVLDSPFGQLDEAYRTTIAKKIPQMARQVVLLLSRSQGSQKVLEVLEDHVGAEFLLVRHNKEPIGNRPQESRYLKGKEFKTAVFDSTFDGTEVVKVTIQ
ncbi:MAG: AAA family ATPase [Acidobacteriota bacterium]|nr:AAA family ATPase [Acidobacteriota bacterium]